MSEQIIPSTDNSSTAQPTGLIDLSPAEVRLHFESKLRSSARVFQGAVSLLILGCILISLCLSSGSFGQGLLVVTVVAQVFGLMLALMGVLGCVVGASLYLNCRKFNDIFHACDIERDRGMLKTTTFAAELHTPSQHQTLYLTPAATLRTGNHGSMIPVLVANDPETGRTRAVIIDNIAYLVGDKRRHERMQVAVIMIMIMIIGTACAFTTVHWPGGF